jgi:hypothetical protein
MEKAAHKGSLAAGCDVWFTAPLAQSGWTRQLDWYVNYQIMKAGLHMRPEVSAELIAIADSAEAEIPTIKPEAAAPLMIACGSLLPTTTVVVVPDANDGKSWATKCHGIWKQMKSPRARVFLPDALTPDAFKSVWPEKAAVEQIEIVTAL